MPSKSQSEGYILIDNRLAPPEPGIPRFLEGAANRCAHCHAIVIRNPERERPRGYCRKCDAYVCDTCGAKQTCTPYEGFIDQTMTALARGGPMPSLGD